MLAAGLIIAGYVLGSMPFGYWLVRALKHQDIRAVGSGNIGATNVWRTYGRAYGAPVVLLDVLKGFVPALLATILVAHWCGVLAGAAAMAGHWRPLFLRFARGGKTVATCGGAFFGVAPLVALCAVAAWLVAFVLLRYASVASMLGAASLPIVAVAIGEPWPVIAFGALAALAVAVLHRPNIGRLVRGTESRFQFRFQFRRLPVRFYRWAAGR